jgi:hypothetical protein
MGEVARMDDMSNRYTLFKEEMKTGFPAKQYTLSLILLKTLQNCYVYTGKSYKCTEQFAPKHKTGDKFDENMTQACSQI